MPSSTCGWFWVTPGEFGSSLVAQRVMNLPAMQETQVKSLGWEDPLEKGMATHSSILAWRISWNLACSSSWGHKVRQDWEKFPSLLGEYSWFVWVFDVNGYFYLYCKSNKYTLAVRKPYPSQIRNVWRKGEFSCLHCHSTADTVYMLQIRGGGSGFGG